MPSATHFQFLWLLILLIISTHTVRPATYDQITLPQFHKQALLNGLEFLFFSDDSVRSSFVLMIRNGAAFDPVGKWGVTYLTTQMMLERTEYRTGQHVRQSLEKMDAELDFRVDWDGIIFFGSAPLDHVTDVLNLLAEVVVQPRFTEEAFEKLRDRLAQQVEQELLQVSVRTESLFLAELFRGNPYEHSVRGTPETLANLLFTDVKVQYRKLFLPNQAQLALEYSGDSDHFLKEVGGRWGIWRRKDPAPFTFRKAERPGQPRILLINSPGTESLFRWGNLGVERSANDYYVLKILEQYLMLSLPDWAEQITMQSQIRASSRLATRKMSGYLQLSIQALPPQLIAYFQRFQEFVDDLHQGRIDAEKFEEAKRLVYVQVIQSLEQPQSRLLQLLEVTLYGVGVNFISHYGLRLGRISAQEFKDAIPKYLSMKDFVMIISGPEDMLGPAFERFGEVTILK